MSISSPLVGVSHEPDQSHIAGKAQQTGGWNSGAVALPMFSMTEFLVVFNTAVMVVLKEEVKWTRSASETCW